MTMRRIARPLAVTVVATLSVAGLASCSNSAAGAGDVVVGAIYPTQGDQAVGGTQVLRGVRLAVDWINEHGGIHGHDVRLVTESVARAEGVPEAMAALAAR